MGALADIVRSGKALYVGLSNYKPDQLKQAAEILEAKGVQCLIHQHRYSMLDRSGKALNPVLEEKGIGSIAFCPLAQGLLTDKYLKGIPANSRAASASVFLKQSEITPEYLKMAYAIQDGKLTSVILGASRLGQILDNLGALEHMDFTEEEMAAIEKILLP